MNTNVQASSLDEDAAFEAALAPLRAKFVNTCEGYVLDIEWLLGEIRGDRNPSAAFSEILNLTHRISGVAASFGYSSLGTNAARIENHILGARKAGVADGKTFAQIEPAIEELLDGLETVLDG
ncbi:MAG: hypothetical protein GY945_14140 [Rhodobacteraceae bacterium]|nr:hypothetical protein [Paracoccaceae bacterium]